MANSASSWLLSKSIFLWVNLALVLAFTMVVAVCGMLEVFDLASRNSVLLRAEHDDSCHLYVYPYNEFGSEIKFGLYSEDQNADTTRMDGSNFAAAVLTDTGAYSRVNRGQTYSLKARECALVINSSASGALSFVHVGLLTSIPPRPVKFEACRPPLGGGSSRFHGTGYTRDYVTLFSLATIVVWSCQRLLQVLRECFSLSFEAEYPITTVAENSGIFLPGVSSLLKATTGGHRIVLWNAYYVVCRPYVLYSVLPAVLLKPFTSIRMHVGCPQLITQNGNSIQVVGGLLLASVVVFAGAINWIVDLGSWKAQSVSQNRSWNDIWANRFRAFESTRQGCEHAHSWQNYIDNTLCLAVSVFAGFVVITSWPAHFILEVRWLGGSNWPGHAVSQRAYILRFCAFALWLWDTMVYFLKFFAMSDRAVEAFTMIRQGSTKSEFEQRMYSLSQLKNMGMSALELKTAGFTALELRTEGFTALELKSAGFTTLELQTAGSTWLELNEAGCTASELRTAGFSALELKAEGFPLSSIKVAGYTASELVTARYSASELKAEGITASELLTAGFVASELKTAGFTLWELKNARCTVSDLKSAGFLASELKTLDLPASVLKTAGFSLSELNKAGCTASELKAAGFTAPQIKSAGYAASELKIAGFSVLELKAAGYALFQLNTAGCTASELTTAGFTALELKDVGFAASELKTAGCTVSALKAAGFTALELKVLGCTASELQSAGCNASRLKAAGFTALELERAGFRASQLKTAGFTLSDLKLTAFSGSELRHSGFAVTELEAVGISASDVGGVREI